MIRGDDEQLYVNKSASLGEINKCLKGPNHQSSLKERETESAPGLLVAATPTASHPRLSLSL